MTQHNISRSYVIPVLDFSPHSPYNIRTLLDDLRDVPGEVICIFNSEAVYQELHSHKRINKYCRNNLNAGVSRSWNIGINLAEGKAVFVLNADLHVRPAAFDALETYLFGLDRAVIVGPEGAHINYQTNTSLCFTKGNFDRPVQTHSVSGFFFAIHLERFLSHRPMFDVQFSPCFFEEWDMGRQVMEAGLACYAVPVRDFEHHWGMSLLYKGDHRISYFGRELRWDEIMSENKKKFMAKWPHLFPGEDGRPPR